MDDGEQWGMDGFRRHRVDAGLVALAYAVVCTCIIGTVIDKMIGLRVSEEDEVTGIDQIEHLETAYDHVGSAGASHLLTGA